MPLACPRRFPVSVPCTGESAGVSVRVRNQTMAEVYRAWKLAEAGTHPHDRKGYATLARVFGVSIHVARHAVAYNR